MKKFIPICLAIFGIMGVNNSTNAATGFVKGKVELIRTHDPQQQPSWKPPAFWFTLKGVSKAGACPKWAEGKVLFVAQDSQAFSLVSDALSSGKEIAVAYDDALLANGGYCAAGYITIGSPSILY